MSLRVCPVGHVRHRRGWFADHLELWSGRDWQAYQLAPMPPWLAAAWHDVVGVTPVKCVPALYALTDAGGAGGFTEGTVVAVGLRDLEGLIEKAFASGALRAVPANDTHRCVGWTPAQLRRYLATTLLGHEVGHVRRRHSEVAPNGIAEELDCDEHAGVVDALLGVPHQLGEVLMEQIGCSFRGCTHPPPAARVAAYRRGRMRALWRRAG